MKWGGLGRVVTLGAATPARCRGAGFCTGGLAALAAALTVAVALVAGLPWGTPVAAAVDRDCSDFPNQAAAQEYFLSKGGPDTDPDRLDQDDDGVACESLPCPCKGAPNIDLLVSVIFLVALSTVDAAFFWWQRRPNRKHPLEGGTAFTVGGLLVVSTLGALLAVVNFLLNDPLIEDIVPFLLSFLIPSLAAVIMSASVYRRGKQRYPESGKGEGRDHP
jgi:hypothetical protein